MGRAATRAPEDGPHGGPHGGPDGGLEVEGLAVDRGGIALLEGVSFRVGPGQALVLRGPNGAGKTTLLRTIAGLQPPLAGRISAPPEAIAYAAHADGIKAVLSVTENLAFWAAIHGRPEGIGDALSAMNLESLARRRAGSLSAGQKRRLGLARLLVTGRPIWLLDEPTVSLDTASVALFGAVVRAHLAAGGAALLATHIDLGLQAEVLEVAAFKARSPAEGGLAGGFDDSFDGAFG
ncbi:heme ABC exporter ATP-binding protein CcmA [Frigidibacter sp. MR17.24]|uniref:heme ABC exporter ATP-binding protein CcmA n=1 Tax=Frigidibacter sp. MR17.24 TaxID=3127345 RepID=UPI0030129F77